MLQLLFQCSEHHTSEYQYVCRLWSVLRSNSAPEISFAQPLTRRFLSHADILQLNERRILQMFDSNTARRIPLDETSFQIDPFLQVFPLRPVFDPLAHSKLEIEGQSFKAINDIYVDGEQYEELRQSIEESVRGHSEAAPCSFLRVLGSGI